MSSPTDRNVFILGAGASSDAGAPLIYDFLERSRQFLNNPPSALDEYGLAQFRQVFDFKREMARSREKISVDLDNIEDLFGLVEMSCRLGQTGRDTRKSTVYLIVKTLELCLEPRRNRPHLGFRVERGHLSELEGVSYAKRDSSDDPRFTIDMYEYLALMLAGRLDIPERRRGREDVVITFNYDLLIDDALQQVDLLPWYGPGFHDPPEPQPNSVQLLKLHGSANWAFCPECKKPILRYHKVTHFVVRLGQLSCPVCGASCQPLLVPPSWDKTEYSDTMSPVWKLAVEKLKTATRICVVGYSIPDSDAFFRHLITLALADNHQLERLIVVDKDSKVEMKWKRLLDPVFRQRRFTFSGQGFALYLAGQRSCSDLNRGEYIRDNRLYGSM